MMRNCLLLLVVVALSIGVMLRAADPSDVGEKQGPTPAVMQAKLARVQVIVEGLVQKDFDAVASAGDELFRLCEGKGWHTHADSRYEAYRAELARDSTRLAELARTKNLEGATYAYVTLISTCVDCHAHCRDVLQIAKETPVLHAVPKPVDVDNSAANCRN
jgi:hypothetical protein